MSATTAKPSDDTTAAPQPALYVNVEQAPNGEIARVSLSRYDFDAEEVFSDSPRITVWAAPSPTYGGDYAHASKVLDLAVSNLYRDQDGNGWAEGERAATRFHYDYTKERAFLRTVEAHLIRAGFTNAYTGMVACQQYGVRLAGADNHYAFRNSHGWHLATDDCTSVEGWYLQPGILAPAGASPHRVAAALLVNLVAAEEIEPAQLSLLWRLRTRTGVFRATPHWANLKFRARQRLDRYRRRVTIRTR
ncbi:hypothetical protein ACWD1Y_11495 [Streptomyces sp. NPDC002814]